MFTVAAAVLAFAIPAAHAQDCAEASSPAQLDATLQAAEAGWIKADEAGFLLKVEEAIIQLPCVSAPIEPPLAARYHQALGLWLFASQQPEMAQDAFAAARRIAPSAGLSDDLAPVGHPARKLYDGSTPDDSTAAAPTPAAGQVLFDGAPGERPTAVNTIFQLEADGATSLTRYLRPDADLPSYDVYVVPKKTGLRGVHFLAGAGAMAAASGGLLVAARSTHSSFTEEPPGNIDDLDALYNRNRALSTSSAVLAGTAGALGLVAVFTW